VLVKRLEIQGFKSFAEHVALEFGPGATGIVGPNGAGKSNVTDAIRWALGEQNPRLLRSSRMEDIIFGGSGTRKPLGFAEVTLILDNEDGRLPLDYAEVSLTRRLYRSGESEYLLNGSPARLRDITELLSGTGLGREGYSLIGQGRIDEVLMSTPESRRGLFDEACGIGLHRGRKREALSRLEDVAARLERVSDVTSELDTQLDPLAKQATVARAFVSYRDELERLELWLENVGLGRLRARLASARERLAEAGQKGASLRERLVRLEDEARTLRAAQGELGSLLERKQEEAALSEAALRQLVSKLQGLERVVAEREREAQLLREEQGRLGERLERAKARQAELEAERTARADRLVAARAEMTLGSEAETAARAAVGVLRAGVETVKSELLEVVSQVSAARFELSSAEADVGRMRAEEARLAREGEAAKAETAQLAAELGAAAVRLGALGPEVETGRKDLADLADREAALGVRLADLGRAAERERGLIAEFEGEKASLEAASAAASRWARSAMAAVAAATGAVGEAPGWAGGLVGVLGEELETNPAEKLALEVALGRYAGALVVRTEDNVRSYMRHFKAQGLGPAVVIPLDLVNAHVRRRGAPAGGFRRLADRVSCREELRAVVELLLGDTALAGDFEEARRVVDEGSARKAVTTDGLLVRPAGVVWVGEGGTGTRREAGQEAADSSGVPGGESLERLRRLKDVRAELAGRRERLTSLAAEREAAERDLAGVRHSRARLGPRYQELALERAGLAEKSENLRRREETLRQRAEAAGLDLPDLGRRILEREAGAKAVAERLRELGRRETGLRQELGRQEEETRTADDSLAAAGRRVGESRVAIATLEEQERAGTAEAGRITDETARLAADRERLDRRLAELAEEREAARVESAPLREKLAAASGAAGAQPGEDLEAWRQRRKEMAGELGTREEAVVQARTELEETGERERREEMRLARLEAEEEMTLRRLRRDWGEEWEAKASRAAQAMDDPAAPPALTEEAAQARVEELRKALSGLGVVNIGAIDEHRRLTERAEFLRGQARDLGEAREGLLKLISEMDETMAQRFEEGFLAVRRAFRERISRLFGGGRGDLLLTDREHILDSGIEIVIEPPAKRLQSLALLSTGERALAALALMLSFLDVRPSPFVVLDEIDAPLDDANVARFGESVSELVGQVQTQFILVTHNKATMEVADSLYGVTMGEDGVSRLVSVKLEEREEFTRRMAREAV
jgi:chromosome segregation protein